MSIKDRAFFCPSCNSANVSFSVLEDGAADCKTCSWNGTRKDLVSYSFEHDLGTSSEVLNSFTNDFKNTMAQHFATPLAALLLKWGFFPEKISPKNLGNYLKVSANAVVLALFKERARLEKEYAERNRS